MKRALVGLGLGLVLGFLACKTTKGSSTPPTEPPPVTAAEPVESQDPDGPQATAEPEHPWPVAVLDVRGHAPLPEEAHHVWLTMDGIGATVATGEIHKISLLLDGRPEQAGSNYLLPVLYDTLSVHPEKGVLVIWADEQISIDTVIRALYTGGRAGYREYAFVVGKPGTREIIRVDPPKFMARGVELTGPAWADLELSWGPQGVAAVLAARYGDATPVAPALSVPLDLGGGNCIVPGGARVDAAALGEALDQMCTAADGKRFALRVQLNAAGSIGDVLWALAADRRPPSCYRPAIVEAALDSEPRTCEGAKSIDAAIAGFPPTYRVRSFEEIAQDIARDEAALRDLAEGDDSSAGFGGRGKLIAKVKQGKHTVKGPLDADIIRRIVRAHLNEVRYCYHQGLVRDEALAGRLEIAFTIGAKGKVSASKVASSTLPDENVGRCVAKAIKRWKFPKPIGGKTVKVRYPFELSPGSGQGDSP